ncbi:hypothetical protein K380107A5_08700 [Holdemania massiliensis]|uniref:LexA family protein n=1 Tax=Holdemania massiliensis TaxID=1468449 RepID=UPI0036F1F16F
MPRNIQFGKMVERYMRLNKLTMKELGEKVGRGESTVSMWIANKSTPPMGIVQKLADLFGVTTDTMIYGDDCAEEIEIIFDDYFPLHYATNLSAGTLEELLNSEPDAVVYVPIKYQMMKKRLHAFKVNGTSMNNIFADGSIVVCEDVTSTMQLKDGTIVVVLVNGLATVKRLYVRDNQVTLLPDSTDKNYLPIVINTEDQEVQVAGRVIWHMNPDDISKNY